ncbi:DUF6449 domain-containing protein [Neobacillus niacini]|uniref:DUF6449 domain-containing protein n=1 Tax=Neobacillus niacini TaxID=86668 RepID=UPI00285B55BC|nr:DUF6449 domain-containing protein [Neobacillus niacini]MDR7001242.1 ABC-2 type transport system permease protein [Neobacillus niacini]
MPSKMSSFNKELILQICRSTGWISIVYFLGLLFALPLQLVLMYSSEEEKKFYYNNTQSLFQTDFEIQIGLMVIIPVLLAVFLFRFLHVKQASDLMHSIPLKREKIFHHYAITGIIFLILPVAVTSLLLFIICLNLDLTTIFSTTDIFTWAGTTILFDLLLFTAGMFIAMMTGLSVVQAVLTYIFVLFPVGITILVFSNLKILLYGFPSDYLLNRNLENMSPITMAASFNTKTLDWKYVVIYLLFSILLYGLSLFFYKKRKLEAASEAIAIVNLRLVFKYGVTICVMLLGGMYFTEVQNYQNSNTGWTIFGYVIGAVFGYFIAEMVLQKTWRVFSRKRLKGLVIFLAVTAVFFLGVKTLGVYEKRVPEQSEIQNVLITDNPYLFNNQYSSAEKFYVPKPLKEEGNIEAIRKLHTQIIANKKLNKEHKAGLSEVLFLRYKLKNGKYVTREYRVDKRLYNDSFKTINESKEYKLAMNEIFNLDVSKIRAIYISNNTPGGRELTLADENEIKEAISLLKSDILAESYEDSVYYQERGSRIEVELGKGRTFYLTLKPTYVNFQKWLKKKNLLEKATVTPKDISKILVVKRDLSHEFDSEESIQQMEKDTDSLKSTNKLQIELALQSASEQLQKDYAVVFYYKKGDYKQVLFFDEAHAPDFVKEHFK